MGKAKKSRQSTARALTSPTARPLNPAEVAANVTLRETKILPVVKNLGSASPKQRSEAVAAIVNLLEDPTCRRLLLKERVVQKIMEETLNDSNQEVVVYGWGALRNVAAEEGYDQCIFMYRKDILTPAAAAVAKITSAIENITKNSNALNGAEKKLLWKYIENLIGLITTLSEMSQEVVDAIIKIPFLLHFLISLLLPSQVIPLSVQEAAAQCLHALTEENVTTVKQIIENENYVSLLLQTKDDIQPEACLKTIFVCGILHNVSLASSSHQFSDSLILPILTNIIKTTSLSQENSDLSLSPLSLSANQRILAVQTALEIIASIATAVQSNEETQFKIDVDGDVELGDEEDDDDKGIDDDVLADIDLVVGGESGTGIVEGGAEDILAYLLTVTAPLILSFAQGMSTGGNTPPLALQTRALSVLNNIAWASNVTVPSGSSLWSKWEKLAVTIWDEVVVAILGANTADIELADALAGVAWAIAKGTSGKVGVGGGVVEAFIGLYGAAGGADGEGLGEGAEGLRGKCVGVLGCLGMAEGRVDVNKQIGVFLMTLIAAAPNTPTEPTVEAVNVIMDVYADADFDYDRPVFVNCGFLAHLQKALPGVRTMVRRIDKKKSPEDRHRADEVALNLQRFIQYKVKESSVKGLR